MAIVIEVVLSWQIYLFIHSPNLMVEKQFSNSKEYLRQLINIAYISMSIPLLIFGWLYLEVSTNRIEPIVSPDKVNMIFILSTVITIGLLWMGNRRYQQKLSLARTEETLVNKLLLYKKAVFIRFLLFGIAAMVTTIGIYLTASELFAITFSIVVVLFSINNPSLYRIAKALQLEGEEKEHILKSKEL